MRENVLITKGKPCGLSANGKEWMNKRGMPIVVLDLVISWIPTTIELDTKLDYVYHWVFYTAGNAAGLRRAALDIKRTLSCDIADSDPREYYLRGHGEDHEGKLFDGDCYMLTLPEWDTDGIIARNLVEAIAKNFNVLRPFLLPNGV